MFNIYLFINRSLEFLKISLFPCSYLSFQFSSKFSLPNFLTLHVYLEEQFITNASFLRRYPLFRNVLYRRNREKGSFQSLVRSQISENFSKAENNRVEWNQGMSVLLNIIEF